MNKAKIVQRLLDEKHITAEEAAVLFTDTHHYTYPTVKMKFENYGSPLLGDKIEAMVITWKD